MEQSPSSADQEMICLPWNLSFTAVFTTASQLPILSQTNSVHTLPNSHVNSNLHLLVRLPSGLFPSRLRNKILNALLISLYVPISTSLIYSS